MRLRGRLIISDAGAPPTQARRACRTWPACGCRPASAPPRKALSVIRRPRRAAPERITGHYAVHICQSALRSGAFSAGRLFQSGNSRAGPGNGLITARRKMAGRPRCGQQARGSPPARVILSLAATGQNGSWLGPGAARARTGRVRNGGKPATSQVGRHNGKAGALAGPWPGPGQGPARLGSSPGGPRLAQVRPGAPGPRWPYPASLIANPRYGPSGINVRLRSRNAVSVTRNEFRPPATYPQIQGPAPRGLAARPASLLTGGPLHGGSPRWPGAAARVRAAAPGGRTRRAAENPITNRSRADNRTCQKSA